jgi:hypothetical protein
MLGNVQQKQSVTDGRVQYTQIGRNHIIREYQMRIPLFLLKEHSHHINGHTNYIHLTLSNSICHCRI